MAKTYSTTTLSLGTEATDFTLMDTVTHKSINLFSHTQDRPFVLAFICNHCPYVVHIRKVLTRVFKELLDQGVCCVAISSNDATAYPEDGPEKMHLLALAERFSFPYLYDAEQSVAKTYQAACTPEFYLFNESRKLVYHGQFDSSRPGNGLPVTGEDLKKACEEMLEGKPVFSEQVPSMGCNIKWNM